MTTLHLSQKLVTLRQTRKRQESVKSYGSILHIALVSNVGKIFLKLIKNHFPKGNSLNKIFNKNTVKLSYSCMGNILSIISSENKSILNPVSNTKYGCNCRSKESCPLQNKCLTPKVVCRADVKKVTND